MRIDRTLPTLLLTLLCATAWPLLGQPVDEKPTGAGSPEAAAASASTLPASSEPASGRAWDQADLEGFIDSWMTERMGDPENVGAVVALVSQGELLFARGYGVADLETGRTVDAERTRFHIASISKLFIWTAVMQLVEDGRLDLHTDINRYLTSFQVPEAFGQPITMAHLMTHTPGFDNRAQGLFAREGSALPTLAEAVEQMLPARITPPGEQSAYSNYGSGLAALIVQEVAGEPYERVVQTRILDPLGMHDTSLAQPQAGRFAEHLAHPYQFDGETLRLQADLVPLAPAGSITSTANDMAQFMIAFLGDGAVGGQRMLRPETVQQMRTPLITLDPAINPLVHGFANLSTRGVQIHGHFGGGTGATTALALLPDHDLGIFVAFNSGSDSNAQFFDAFVDRTFDAPPPPGDPPADFLERATKFTGQYRPNTTPRSTFLRVLGLGEAIDVDVSENGELLVLGLPIVEIAPRVFRSRDGERGLVFLEGEDGRMSHFYIAEDPGEAFLRVPLSEGRRLHLSILLLGLLSFVGTIAAWPLGWIWSRWRRAETDTTNRLPRGARLALWSSAALLLATLIGVFAYVPDLRRIMYGEVGPLRVVFALPLIALVPFAIAVASTFVAWRRKTGTVVGRLAYTGTVASMALFYWFLNTWNLLGYHF